MHERQEEAADEKEDDDAEDDCAGDTLVQIIEILQCRRAHGL